jgi:hypothetical protein
MTKLAAMKVSGASGTDYLFELYTLNTPLKFHRAVYIITKRVVKPDGRGTHAYLYVGQTGHLTTRLEDHHKRECFDRSGANCVGIHLDGSEKSRRFKESDLYDAHEWPCNE